MKKKKLYECPAFSLVKIDVADVLTASLDEFDAKDYNLTAWW